MTVRSFSIRLIFGFMIACILGLSYELGAQTNADSVTFSIKSAEPGDQLDQSLTVASDLKIRKRQAQEIIEEEQRESGRHQHRLVTVRSIEDERITEADAHFIASEESFQANKANDPVVGKTYRCKIKDDKLTILTESGDIPPIAEYRVVARAMETLGKPNPLASYLVGKRVVIGETLKLPNKIAQEAFGLDKKLGEVEKFTLKLETINTVGTVNVAIFKAAIEAAGSGSTQMRLFLDGEVAINATSSRVVSADLSGPIGMLESRGSYGNNYLVDGTGKMHLHISSNYLEVR